jgi:hypothetical protein
MKIILTTRKFIESIIWYLIFNPNIIYLLPLEIRIMSKEMFMFSIVLDKLLPPVQKIIGPRMAKLR